MHWCAVSCEYVTNSRVRHILVGNRSNRWLLFPRMTRFLRSMLALAMGAAVAVAVPVVKNAALPKRVDFAAYSGGALPKTAPILAGDWSVRAAFPNLTFQNPLGLCAVPGTND